jgi:glycosyltransferase involved in cell wall biosynthesis
MKILMVSSLLNSTPPMGYGGVERFVHGLATKLVAHGDEVFMLRKSGTNKIVYDKKNVEREADLVSVLVKAIEEFKPDLIQIHNSKDKKLLDYLSGLDMPIVFTIHNNVRPSSGWIKVIENACRNFYFTSISNSLRLRILKAVSRPGVDVENLGYGLDVCKIHNNYKAPKSYNFDYYLYLGVIARYKGVLDVSEAFVKLKRNLLIVGPCNDIKEDDYFKEVMTVCKNSPYVRYYGSTKNDKEKFRIINGSSGLVIATGYDKKESDCHEAFGLVMLEANALSKPVIGYAKGNVADYITDGINGYKFIDIEELDNILKKVETTDWEKSCFQHACEYDLDRIVINYKNYFKEILSK